MGKEVNTFEDAGKGITRYWANYKGNRGALYRMVRARLGITQKMMSSILGLDRCNLAMREGHKRVYTVEEMVALHHLSGLTWQELGEIMQEIAGNSLK